MNGRSTIPTGDTVDCTGVLIGNSDIEPTSERGETPIVETADGLTLSLPASSHTLAGHEHLAGAWDDYDPTAYRSPQPFTGRDPRKGREL